MAHTRSKIRRNVYKRFTLLALRAVDIIRPYSSRFSKKKYTQRQHVVMLMLKKRLRCSYRELVQLFELMPELAKILKLTELPHFTPLQIYVFARFPSRLFARVLNQTLAFFNTGEILSIDSSGYSIRHMSSHYEKRCGMNRPYIKSSLAVDARSQAIVADKVRKSHAHDVKDFRQLICRARGYTTLVADKGYDAEWCHREAKKHGMRAVIPVRTRGRTRVMGRNRARTYRNFDERVYHQRSKSETVNSVEKRKFGDELSSRSTPLQKQEVRLMNVCYNIYRAAASVAALLGQRISTKLL